MCSSAVRISRFLFEWFAVGLLFADHCFEGLGLYSSELKPEVSGQRAVCGLRSSDERRKFDRRPSKDHPRKTVCMEPCELLASPIIRVWGLGFRL